MSSAKQFLHYLAIATGILLIAGLAGWYFFLNKQEQTISDISAGRGLGSDAPVFGDGAGNTYSNVSDAGTGTSSEIEAKTPPRLWQVTKTPVAGMGFVAEASAAAAASATSSRLYFAERGTGYIIAADAATGQLSRLSNKLFTRVHEAVFDSRGGVVLRLINDEGRVASFASPAPGQSAVATSSPKKSAGSAEAVQLSGKYLEPDIRAIAPMQKTRELLILAPEISGGTNVILSSWDGTKQKTLFTSPLTNWRLFSLSDGRIFLSSRPSDGVTGFAFELKNGALVPRLRNISGLTFLPRPSSDAVLFGKSSENDVSLFASSKEGAAPVYLPIRTIADKCVWAPPPAPTPTKDKKTAALAQGPLIAYCAVPDYFATKNFLMDWYRGVLHTSDTWWRVDAGSGEATALYEPGDTDGEFDVENPVIDGAGEQIAFMDAKDKSLWLLRIKK